MSNTDQGTPSGINTKLVNLLVVLGIICAVTFLLFWAVPQLFRGSAEVQSNVVAPATKEIKEDLNQVSPGVRKAMIAANENQYFRGNFVPTDGYDSIKFIWVDRELGVATMMGKWSRDGEPNKVGYVRVIVNPDRMFVGPFSEEMEQ